MCVCVFVCVCVYVGAENCVREEGGRGGLVCPFVDEAGVEERLGKRHSSIHAVQNHVQHIFDSYLDMLACTLYKWSCPVPPTL